MNATPSADLAALFEQARELLAMQQAEDAEAVIREGLRRVPGNGSFQSLLPYALLMQGKLRDGFREYESRQTRRALLERKLNIPEWDGPIAGRSILLWGEQGIGDEIQTGRFLRRFRELGARQIQVACLGANVRVFQQLGAEVVVDREAEQMRLSPPPDCWVKMWSIPHRLGVTLEDLSGGPYLSAQPQGRGGLGLVERGNPKNARDPHRSMPAGLLQAAFPQGRPLEPAGDSLDSLGQIAGLDLVITVDTSWAHMAGALGVPCFVLLPYRDLDWRWLRQRADSPWYDSVRLFRQPAPGDWDSVVAEVRAALG